jgi:hypothetical protein
VFGLADTPPYDDCPANLRDSEGNPFAASSYEALEG